jgi:hypothetical protein
LISIDALIKLMFIRVEVDDPALIDKVRRILLPFEYTRVDNIVDLVFETQQETEQKAQTSAELDLEEDKGEQGEHGTWNFTPSDQLEDKRWQVVNAFFKLKSVEPIKRSRTNFSDVLPIQFVESILPSLNTTKKGDKEYWHVALANEQGQLALNLSTIAKRISLSPYAIKI